MPKLNDATMDELGKTTGAYNFSGVRVDELGAAEYTLATILVDASSSVAPFESDLENALKEAVRACQLSPRADNLLIRLIRFNRVFDEIHGFKLLQNINLDDYTGVLKCGGTTLLYDSLLNSIEATTKYAKDLVKNDMDVNAITILLTDGMDNESKFGVDMIREKIQVALKSESLESITSILVGVNVTDPTVSDYLNKMRAEAGFDKYLELKDASQKTLAKLANFISKSISATSQALGSGGASQQLPTF